MARAQALVVDDKDNIVKLLERVLGESHEVTTASHGQRAISLVASRAFDVVLTDIRMPGADGFEVLRFVKARAPETEVVVMTAYATVPDAVSAMKQGADDYLQKPSIRTTRRWWLHEPWSAGGCTRTLHPPMGR